jgi:hypothetical protein
MLENNSTYRNNIYEKLVISIFIIFYIVRLYSGRSLTAIHFQPMKAPELDYTFWILLLTQIPQFLISHYYISLFVDIAILFLAFYMLIKQRNIYIKFIFILLFFIQHITVETYSCMHSKSSVIIFIAFLPIFFKKNNFTLMVEFARYFLAFILLSAAYHKIHNEAIFCTPHFQIILFEQHLDLQILNPTHFSYKLAVFLRSNVYYAYIAFLMLFFTQLSFIIAFFTKKYDAMLVLFLVIFILLTYIVMRIYIFELLIIIPAFLYFIYPKQKLFFTKNTAQINFSA